MRFVTNEEATMWTLTALEAGGLIEIEEDGDVVGPVIRKEVEDLETVAHSLGLQQMTTVVSYDDDRALQVRWYREVPGDLAKPTDVHGQA